MRTEFFIPKLGQTVEEVTLVKWLVQDGAKVDQGQELLEVETDKAVFPVEANGKGYIHIGPYAEGQVIPVLEVVAIIGSPEDKFVPAKLGIEEESAPVAASAQAAVSTPANTSTEQSKVFASPRAKMVAREKGVNLAEVQPTGGNGVRVVAQDVLAYLKQIEAKAPKATPVAQRVAAATGVDLQAISGTGPGGRIFKADVERASTLQSGQPAKLASAPAQAAAPSPDSLVTERIPLKGVRAIIADRMGTSAQTTARVTLMMDVDATQFVDARTRLKERVEKAWGFAPGYNDMLAKIVAIALQKFPYMNARLTPDAIELMAHINIGMAVDTERGLLVPVIHDANLKSIHQFGSEFRSMVDRARQGRALPDDLTGGTFTITNLGMFDVDAFTPVINLPEAAILGVGRILPKPAVYNGAIAIRQMMTLSLVFDHRVNDGAPAARFLQFIKQVIEEPYLMLTE